MLFIQKTITKRLLQKCETHVILAKINLGYVFQIILSIERSYRMQGGPEFGIQILRVRTGHCKNNSL